VTSSNALSAGMRRVLRAVQARAADRLAAAGSRSTDDLCGALDSLIDRVCAIAADAGGTGAAGAPHVFPAELVDVFRREFLLHITEHGAGKAGARELAAVLLALDGLTNAENDAPSTTFAGRLASLDAVRGMTEIAHDMRSPLAAILLLVEPIRRGHKGPVTPVQERQLGLIYGAALSLSALSNDIIEAARSDRAVLVARPFSIRATLDDACTLVRPIAEEKRLDLHVSYPSVDARIGDCAALHRIVLNLVTNALKYTETGSVTIECTEVSDADIDFAVHDTGEGIPAHVLATLSDGLHTGQAGFRYSSSGLGLAICKALLEKMGSTLHIGPQPSGRGTRMSFRVALPRAPGDR
jgi:signal transduction histidine kinase